MLVARSPLLPPLKPKPGLNGAPGKIPTSRKSGETWGHPQKTVLLVVPDGRGRQSSQLADDEDFADVVAGEEEFDGAEVAKQSFHVAIIKDALQAETAIDGSMNGSGRAFAE